MPKPINRYWFDPEICKLYGPSPLCHYDVIKDNEDLANDVAIPIDINEENMSELLGAVQNILLNKGFVRIYFNNDTNELGICCTKAKNALKTVRNFVEKYNFTVDSLFLDINDIKVQTGIKGKDLDLYIKHGRI